MISRRIQICPGPESKAAALLASALRRSFTDGQVEAGGLVGRGPFNVFAGGVAPGELRAAIRQGGKILVTGRPAPAVATLLGLRPAPELVIPSAAAQAELCFNEPYHESPGRIRYTGHPLALASPLRERALVRYDYAEWNNLGFGAVRVDDGAFGVSGGVQTDGAVSLARLSLTTAEGEADLGPYLTLLDLPQVSILWCARPAGPLDSVEWQLIERFWADWRAGDLPCLPYLRQNPVGAAVLATMRLDCDEAVASAADLFDLYRSRGLPLSLAVKTGQELGQADLALMRAVRAAGGSLLSHSHTHAPGWGPDREAVRADASLSRQWFRDNLPEEPAPALAVSPFHQNPAYAVSALAEAGFSGFVGGIIDNDPEYLLGRAGRAPGADILSISQQSMLHGDSYRNQDQSVDVHLRAFALQAQSGGLFGYLDHPFSERYHYGWDSEEQRLTAHKQLLDGLLADGRALFWSQEQCFNWVAALASARLEAASSGRIRSAISWAAPGRPQYRFEQADWPFGS